MFQLARSNQYRFLLRVLACVLPLAPTAQAAMDDPQDVIAAHFPEMGELRRALMPEIKALEARLDQVETRGADTSCLRQALSEMRWRLASTGDADAARAAMQRLRDWAAMPVQPSAHMQDTEGSFGICTEPWFLKLDASADPFLLTVPDPGLQRPSFLDRVNDPERLLGYLRSLVVSRLAVDGIDRRKELNFATADLLRLIIRNRPPNYTWAPGTDAAVRAFIAEWQDPTTGFFGATYEVEGRRYTTTDLSFTFHMASYLDGKIGHWQGITETLLRIRDDQYPNGWLDPEGMTSHNNYDVVTLFRFAWPEMRPEQRTRAAAEIQRLADWCLTTAIAPDGTVVARAAGESLPESYYFTLAFLDVIGYFDAKRRFWTDRDFPEVDAMTAKLKAHVLALDQKDPMTRWALERFPQK